MAQSPDTENEFDLEDSDEIVDFKGIDWKENAERSLRLALPPVVLLAGFFVLASGFVWASIDRPFYLEIAGLHLICALTMIVCGVRWRKHPPKNASAATALLISGLYLLSGFAMVAYPDPVLGLLPLFLVAVTAFFVVNTRWMLFAYGVGFLASGTAIFVEPPTRDLSVIAFLLVIALLSATSFRITRISDFSQLQAWRSQAERRDRQRRKAADQLQRSEADLVAAQRIARVGVLEGVPGAARGGQDSVLGDESAWQRFRRGRPPRGRAARARGRVVYAAARWRITCTCSHRAEQYCELLS